MTAVIVTGGQAPPTNEIREWCSSAGLVVGADSGIEALHAAGVRADLVVGDFDSVGDLKLLDGYEGAVRRFPAAKDFTDTELALRTAREEGATTVILLGGGGGRLDHLLGLVRLFERDEAPDAWVTGSEEVRRIDGSVQLDGQVGDTVSFFPLGCETCRMKSRGLRWELDGLEWNRGDMGISNEFASEVVHLEVVRGRVLMVRPRGDYV